MKTHPIEALLLVVLLVVEALATLVAALVALQQCCRRETPQPASAPTAPTAPPPPPTPHPLAALSLAPAGTVAQLRHRARAAGLPPTLARSGRRDALLSALAGLEVALI
jgi:hypothetical protein